MNENLAQLTNLITLTERELCLLAVVVTEMIQCGLDPYKHHYLVQVEPRIQRLYFHTGGLSFVLLSQKLS